MKYFYESIVIVLLATTLARPVVKWKILFYSTKNISGDYTCEASNGVGLAQSYSIQLKVYAQPYFIKEPESQTAAEEITPETAKAREEEVFAAWGCQPFPLSAAMGEVVEGNPMGGDIGGGGRMCGVDGCLIRCACASCDM